MDPISKLNKVGNAVREKAAKPTLTIEIGEPHAEETEQGTPCPKCGTMVSMEPEAAETSEMETK